MRNSSIGENPVKLYHLFLSVIISIQKNDIEKLKAIDEEVKKLTKKAENLTEDAPKLIDVNDLFLRSATPLALMDQFLSELNGHVIVKYDDVKHDKESALNKLTSVELPPHINMQLQIGTKVMVDKIGEQVIFLLSDLINLLRKENISSKYIDELFLSLIDSVTLKRTQSCPALFFANSRKSNNMLDHSASTVSLKK